MGILGRLTIAALLLVAVIAPPGCTSEQKNEAGTFLIEALARWSKFKAEGEAGDFTAQKATLAEAAVWLVENKLHLDLPPAGPAHVQLAHTLLDKPGHPVSEDIAQFAARFLALGLAFPEPAPPAPDPEVIDVVVTPPPDGG